MGSIRLSLCLCFTLVVVCYINDAAAQNIVDCNDYWCKQDCCPNSGFCLRHIPEFPATCHCNPTVRQPIGACPGYKECTWEEFKKCQETCPPNVEAVVTCLNAKGKLACTCTPQRPTKIVVR